MWLMGNRVHRGFVSGLLVLEAVKGSVGAPPCTMVVYRNGIPLRLTVSWSSIVHGPREIQPCAVDLTSTGK